MVIPMRSFVKKDENLSWGTVIFITTLFHDKHQTYGEHDGDTGCQRFICEAETFTDQDEIRLACLEKHFDS